MKVSDFRSVLSARVKALVCASVLVGLTAQRSEAGVMAPGDSESLAVVKFVLEPPAWPEEDSSSNNCYEQEGAGITVLNAANGSVGHSALCSSSECALRIKERRFTPPFDFIVAIHNKAPPMHIPIVAS